MSDKTLSRRTVVAGLPLLLAGCAGGYGAISGEPHPVPFVSVEPGLMRQEVTYRVPYRPNTVVVNIRACLQLSRIMAQASWTPARKFVASLS
jgi:hypothetical protein